MNKLKPIEIEKPIESDSRLEKLIDYIGSLLAEEYFHLMEETNNEQNDENSLFGE